MTFVVRRREVRGCVQQLLFGKADQRTTQQGSERQRIPRIGQRADQRHQVLCLLPPKQVLACLRGERQAGLLERSLVSPEISRNRSEQRYVAWTQASGFAVVELYFDVSDQACADLGDDTGLFVPGAVDSRLWRELHRDLGDARKAVLNGRSRAPQGDIAGFLRRQPFFEAAVYVVENRTARPEVGRDPEDIVWKLLLDGSPHRQIGCEVGPPKAIDRLLRISNEK